MKVGGFAPYTLFLSCQRSCERALRGTGIEKLAKRIKALIEQNRHLFFWCSTATLFAAAPCVFLGAFTIGTGAAMSGYFGLRERRIKHVSWESTQGVISSIIFVLGLLFHCHIQCAWGGLAASWHVYRLYNGQVYKRLKGTAAMEEEMRLVTEEFARWFRFLVPDAKTSDRQVQDLQDLEDDRLMGEELWQE